jgi:hypothetical protein
MSRDCVAWIYLQPKWATNTPPITQPGVDPP